MHCRNTMSTLIVLIAIALQVGCGSLTPTVTIMELPTLITPVSVKTPFFISAPTQGPTPTTERARALAEAGVQRNGDWIPYTEVINGVEMALVPAGCFQMGSEDGLYNERPVHEVCFEEPFWIDVYEVTNEAFGSVGCEDISSASDQPHTCVDWFEAQAHCGARGARLPTEAEWEYAARGPDGWVYPWGNMFDDALTTYCGWGCVAAFGDSPGDNAYRPDTAPVGSYPGGVSWVGVYHMSGNVLEWINDWYSETYYDTLAESVVNPQGPASGEYRVLRGGSYHGIYSGDFHSADRKDADPSVEYDDVGFRCACGYDSP